MGILPMSGRNTGGGVNRTIVIAKVHGRDAHATSG